MKQLRNDQEFYLYCSNTAKSMYAEHYAEDKFIQHFNKIMENI